MHFTWYKCLLDLSTKAAYTYEAMLFSGKLIYNKSNVNEVLDLL